MCATRDNIAFVFKIGFNIVPAWHATCELFLRYEMEDVKVWMVMWL